MQDEVKRFLSDPTRGRPKQQLSPAIGDQYNEMPSSVMDKKSYIDMEKRAEEAEAAVEDNSEGESQGSAERTVDIVLSDMSEPWPQTSGFWKRSLSNPYRMMNTSGILFRDHAGSMVSSIFIFKEVYWI